MSVYFYGCITIDGYLADKNHSLDWLYQTGATEETSFTNFYKNMDVTIMGRRTFHEIEKTANPEAVYPTTQNYVFTHSKQPLPKGFIAKNGSVIDFVKQIEENKNIWIVGGNTILAPLLDCSMVDYLTIQIAPVLLGSGIPLFSQKEMQRRFWLEDVKKYGQFAELVYAKR